MLTYIAQAGEKKPSTGRNISTAIGISEPTVVKTLHLLVRQGVLSSKKGPGGGFHLKVSPNRITLGEILRAVEGRELFCECLAGLQSCSEENPCPLHGKWKLAKQELIDFLESTTLQEMIQTLAETGTKTRKQGEV